jgi:TM2 domain-containing membrane protein YozV
LALFLFIVIVAIALGIVGVVVKGLFYLLVIGVVLFLINLVFGGMIWGRRRSRPAR